MAYLPKTKPKGILGFLRSRPLSSIGILLIILLCGGMGWLYATRGAYGFNSILHRGYTTWTTLTKDDPRLPVAMRTALQVPVPLVTAGRIDWRTAAPGLETGEMPVLNGQTEIDRILLTRIDPQRFRFRVLNSPAGDKTIDAWMAETKAVAMVNGSFFSERGEPSTPVLSDGRPLGPSNYQASHGAFVADDTTASLRDLVTQPWPAAFSGQKQGMVSFPLLIGVDGQSRTQRADRRLLANRTFIAQDGNGRILLGTTKEAFFSLDRLAELLKAAPLDIKLALNLDGGSVACQAVAAGDVKRSFCGTWETHLKGTEIQLQGRLFGTSPRPLPVVLAVFPK